jgi:type IV pilus assembly protein PilB
MSEIPKRPEPPSSAAGQDRRPDLEALLGDDEPAGANGPDITLERVEAGLLVEPSANGGAEHDGGEGGRPERSGLAGGGRGGGAANPGEWVGITRPSPQSSTPRFLTDVIVEMGFAARGEVDDAIETARSAGTTPEKVLLEKGVLTGDSLSRALAERYALEHLDLGTFHVDMTAANLVNTTSAKRYHAVPVAFIDKSTLLVAMADPANVLAVDDMAIMTGHEVRAAVASPEDIVALISRLDRLDDVVGDPGSQLEEAEEEDERLDVREASQDAPAVKLVNQLVAQAVERGASDVHLAREGGELRVRFRVDGVLEDVTTVPRRMAGGVISRVKIMAELDIAERRLPQDGRVGLPVEGRRIDLRVVTLPSVQGESVVIRVLDKEAAVVGLDQLGMAEGERERFESAFREANGAVLVTGPTGSGKSTTLYAALQALNTPEKNIITVEDPVEYEIAGLTQIQISTRTGLTFATGLRAMVRADPDVIMVGEIRDRETARIAVESALTGHLVLSTLHTNDAPTAITRLIEMGIEPFLVASAIDCVVAQRLVRMLCSNCKRRAIIPASVLQNSGYKAVLDLEAYEPAGCRRCGGSGYRGRIGIYEVMTVTKEIQSMALERRPAEEIRDVAVRQGMRRLSDDGLDKVKQGRTSIAEIARVIGSG